MDETDNALSVATLCTEQTCPPPPLTDKFPIHGLRCFYLWSIIQMTHMYCLH